MGKDARPADPAALPFAHSTPDPELLTVGDSEFEAVLPDDAATANLFGFPGRCTPLWEEQLRIDTHAVRTTLPGPIKATFE